MNTPAQLGLTPITVRLAAAYLRKGEGVFACDQLGYDKVSSQIIRFWGANHTDVQSVFDYTMEWRITFFREEKRVRSVDFTLRMSGGSGEPAFKVLEEI